MTPEPAFTLGIEEEYLLVDRASRDLVTDPPAGLLHDALHVVTSVNTGAIAKASKAETATVRTRDGAIAKAIRAARIEALREWKRSS